METPKLQSPKTALSWDGLQPVYVTTLHKSPTPTPAPAPSFVLAGSFYRFINPAYAEFLKSLDIDIERDLKFELKGFKAYSCKTQGCGVDGVFLPIVSCGRYHPHVSHRHASRCVARVMEKIEFIEKHAPATHLIKLDLTVPGWVSKRMHSDDLRLIRRAVNVFLKKLAPMLFHQKSSVGGFYGVHIWKTTKPLEPHLHVHLNLLNVAYNAKDKTFHRFKPLIDHRKVKAAWREALRSVGMWDDPSPSSLPDCYVGYVALASRVRLMGRIRYVFRKPITDLNKNICNCDTSQADPAWVGHVLNYTPRQVFVGWAVSLKRFGFHSSNSILPRCPCCGVPLEYDGRITEIPPEVPWFSIDQGGGLVQVAGVMT